MNVVIAGAGEVGRHLTEVLAAEGHELTLLDIDGAKLDLVAETLDVRTLRGSATRADALLEAGTSRADLFVATTDADETNLLAGSLARGLGAGRVIARVHHSAYHSGIGLNYARHFAIDRLVCPEYLTSLAIAGVLRDPAVQAIEHFARGQLVMERVELSDQAEVLDQPLTALGLPPGFRIGTVTQQGRTFVPTGDTVLQRGDEVTLVGTTELLEKILPRFRRGELRQRRVVIMGGSAVSVWLTRALDRRAFKIKLYVLDRPRAEELAAKLSHATVLEADPTDPDVFAEENIADADAFVAATVSDEHNILGALQAKHLGVPRTVAVINHSTYHHLIEGLGIDRVFSPRLVASREIQRISQRRPIQTVAHLDAHDTKVYEIEVGPRAPAIGKTLMQLELPPRCVLIAVQRGDEVRVPGPRDRVQAGDALVAIADQGVLRKLRKTFS